MARRIVIWLLTAGAGAVASVAAVAAPAHAASLVHCDYQLHTLHGGYWADITITNDGPAIDGWVVYWELPNPASLTVVWEANITQTSPVEFTATNLSSNAVIPAGGTTTFGWSATTSATPSLPIELTINGMNC